jgi:VanZ family protein
MSFDTPNPSRARLGFAWTTLLLTIAAVLLITLSPTPVDRPVRDLIDRVLIKLHENGLPGFINYGVVEFLANVGIFIPIGFFAAIAVSRRLWWIVIFAGPLLSVGIEQAQAFFLPERFATLSDILANSIGSIVGAVIGLFLRLLIAYRDELVIDRALEVHGYRQSSRVGCSI